MKENRSSIVGFALIGVIMLAFSWYNTKQFEKRQKEAFTRDSLAAAAAIQQGAVTDSSAVAAVDSLTEPETLIPEEEGEYCITVSFRLKAITRATTSTPPARRRRPFTPLKTKNSASGSPRRAPSPTRCW